MHALTEQVVAQYPVRKTRRQRADFRAFLTAALAREDIPLLDEVSRFTNSHNLIVGDPDTADFVFTAHYDTPARLPFPNFVSPLNLKITVLIQILLVVVLLAPTLLLGMAVARLTHEWAFGYNVAYLFFLVLFALMLIGPANPSNANDNTSGISVLLEALLTLPEAARGKAAFVFFDHEEAMLLGSQAFAKKHAVPMRDRTLVNFDCVGDGDAFLLLLSKSVNADTRLAAQLASAFQVPPGKTVIQRRQGKAIYPSDQVCFKRYAAVAALRDMGFWGLAVPNLHTPRDTALDRANIEILRGFVHNLVI